MEPSISQSIVLGVLSGVLTSALIGLVLHLLKHIIIPWYQSLVYQGAIISGTWNGFYSNEKEPSYSVLITQRGHHIEADISMHKQPNGDDSIKQFKCKGKFKDNQLTLLYEPKDRTRLGTGAYVMVLLDDGAKLEGECLYLSSGNGNVNSLKEHWKKAA